MQYSDYKVMSHGSVYRIVAHLVNPGLYLWYEEITSKPLKMFNFRKCIDEHF